MKKGWLVLGGLVIALAGCGDDDAATTTAAPVTTTPSMATTTAPPTTTEVATTTIPAEAVLDIEITVAGDTVVVTVDGVPETGRVEIATGAAVRLTVDVDIADEVHVHGYDLTAEVNPESPVIIEFVADIPGIFEVELEDAHRLLVELQVS